MALAGAALAAWSRAAEAGSAREKLAASAIAQRTERAQHPHQFRNIEVFDVASPETIAGAGFLLRAGEKTYAITARHPFSGVLPTKFIGDTREIALGQKVYEAEDILWFAIDHKELASFHLIRKEGCILKKGDALAVVCHDGIVSGKLTGIELGMDNTLLPGQPVRGHLQLQLQGKHELAGNSGAPVVLEETGEVVGILVGALAMGRETAVDFALLEAEPASKVRNPPIPATVFSLPVRHGATNWPEKFPTSILPVDLLALVPGTSMKSIWEERPFLPGASQPALSGVDYSEPLTRDYLFREANFNAVGGKLRKLELLGGRLASAERVEAMFECFFAMLGEPSEAFKFGEYRNKAGHDSVYCRWTGSQSVVTVGAYSSGKGQFLVTLLVHAPGTRVLDMNWSTPLPPALESLRGRIRQLTRGPRL